jgi:hypothetical protein
MATLLPCGEDGHGNDLAYGAPYASVVEAILAQNYGGADGPFRQVVFERNAGLFHKGEELFPTAIEPFDEAPRLRVLLGRGSKFLQAPGKTGAV